jgi:hypothetical protein
MRAPFFAAALCCVPALLGCEGAPSVTATGAMPLTGVADGVHGDGDPRFLLLPPLVPMPTRSGTFDATLQPEVSICRLSEGQCAEAPFAVYTLHSGHGGEHLRVSLEDRHYYVDWNTKSFNLTSSTAYRISVSVEGRVFGHADVALASNGNQLRNLKNNEQIALLNGSTLPIKFWLAKGDVFPLGSSGGTVVTSDGRVSLGFPPGALGSDEQIVVMPVETDSLRVIAGTAHEFRPSPYTFAQPVQLAIQFDPALLAPGARLNDLRLMRKLGSKWVEVAGSGIDLVTNTASGMIPSFSEYAVGTLCEPGQASIGGECVAHWATAVGAGALSVLPDGTLLQWASRTRIDPTTGNSVTFTATFPATGGPFGPIEDEHLVTVHNGSDLVVSAGANEDDAHGFTSTGTHVWSSRTPSSAGPTRMAVIAELDEVWIAPGNGTLSARSLSTGLPVPGKQLASTAAHPVDQDSFVVRSGESIYNVGTSGTVNRLTKEGALDWTWVSPHPVQILLPPAADGRGGIVFTTNGGAWKLNRLTVGGASGFEEEAYTYMNVTAPPVVGCNGSIFVARAEYAHLRFWTPWNSSTFFFEVYGENGRLQWGAPLPAPAWSVVLGSDSHIYLLLEGGIVLVLDQKDGKTKRHLDGFPADAEELLLDRGNLFVRTPDRLLAVGVANLGLDPGAPWPTAHGNHQRTSSSVTTVSCAAPTSYYDFGGGRGGGGR